jgi:hypothetical protein
MQVPALLVEDPQLAGKRGERRRATVLDLDWRSRRLATDERNRRGAGTREERAVARKLEQLRMKEYVHVTGPPACVVITPLLRRQLAEDPQQGHENPAECAVRRDCDTTAQRSARECVKSL